MAVKLYIDKVITFIISISMKIFIIICIIFLLIQCAPKEYGENVLIKEFTPVLQLKKYPENYMDKMVKIRGKVVEESARGIWFTLQDEHIIIHVDCERNIKDLRSIQNRNVTVAGKLGRNNSGYVLFARWLKVVK